MFFRVVFVTCLLALVSANPLENGFESRIVGGRDAKIREFPHHVSIQFSHSDKHVCGGAILSDIWVASAAHCITEDHSKIIIKAGKHNIATFEMPQQIREVAHVIVHEKFKKNIKRNDIAMLKLAKPFNLNSYVNKINLPVHGREPTGTAILSGWGSTSRTAQLLFPGILQAATLELMGAETCEQVYKQIIPSYGSIDRNNVCTAPGHNALSACKGDSGGPLIQGNILVGIVSYGELVCTGRHPTVYTKVSSFVDWMHDKMKNH